jgi:hypothetical protein
MVCFLFSDHIAFPANPAMQSVVHQLVLHPYITQSLKVGSTTGMSPLETLSVKAAQLAQLS